MASTNVICNYFHMAVKVKGLTKEATRFKMYFVLEIFKSYMFLFISGYTEMLVINR